MRAQEGFHTGTNSAVGIAPIHSLQVPPGSAGTERGRSLVALADPLAQLFERLVSSRSLLSLRACFGEWVTTIFRTPSSSIARKFPIVSECYLNFYSGQPSASGIFIFTSAVLDFRRAPRMQGVPMALPQSLESLHEGGAFAGVAWKQFVAGDSPCGVTSRANRIRTRSVLPFLPSPCSVDRPPTRSRNAGSRHRGKSPSADP